MTSIEKYFEMQDDLKEKGYRFETDNFGSVKVKEAIKYPCYFVAEDRYKGCFCLVAVFENGNLTVIKQTTIIPEVIEIVIRSNNDKFMADKAVNKRKYAFNNIYVDLNPISKIKFEAYKNEALFNLTEKHLNSGILTPS
jgi:hypothetical protein